jgi:putative ABC transport system permease protein
VRKGLYPRLAAVNLRKNRQTFLPYLLTCSGTAMMFYIMLTLWGDPALSRMVGGSELQYMLMLGAVVTGIFSVVIVFYAHSFIMKQRKREFGLYNILGMSKGNIGRILAWETLYSAAISIAAGLGLGILFSKLVQLALLKLLRFDVRFGLYIGPAALGLTAALFAGIFLLTLLDSMRVVSLSKPVELLHGSQEGEREPKSKWVLAVLGVLFLCTGYGLAVSVKSGLEALTMFFIAVICVIIGTYLLFTAFSIVLLKRMRANKNYYYKTAHFATVSGMLYRMKKNAGGLASICILSTMVLVTVSTTVCLYMDVDEILDIMYPHEIQVQYFNSEDSAARQDVEQKIQNAVKAQGLSMSDYQAYQLLNIQTADNGGGRFSRKSDSGTVCCFDVINAGDYNTMTGLSVSLAPGEALMYTENTTGEAYTGGSITIGGRSYKLTTLSDFPFKESGAYNKDKEQYYMVVADTAEQKALSDALSEQREAGGMYLSINLDVDGTTEQKIDCAKAVETALTVTGPDGRRGISGNVSGRSVNYQDFLANYGGMLFLGIFLGFLFLMATVLIIYYKQVTEGCDDRERFRIMQNVGMTKSEVKSTIHSQVLIVFFLPLAAAIVHIAFAFPMIRQMLSVLGLSDIALFAYCTLAAIGVFAVLYTLVYVLTARTYYRIVS